MEALHKKYRPLKFDDVVGQDAIIRSLKKVIEDRASHTFLFTGPSGCGKTTLARIAAEKLGCPRQHIEEIDAATNTGVEDMRLVTETLQYRPVGFPVRAIVIDEAHMLSKSAWNSLLKVMEEPPEWVHWFLCTTEPKKVPKTIVTRCTAYELKLLKTGPLIDLLDMVCEEEEISGGDDWDRIISLCAKEAEGSPRQALVNLAVCLGADGYKDALELLRSAEESSEAVELARLLQRNPGWKQIQDLVKSLKGTSPESVRHIVRAYATTVALSSNDTAAVGRSLEIIDAFSEPCHPSDGMSPILMACGHLVLGE